jgi:hypothetical protein
MTVEPRALFCNPGSIHSFPFTTDWRFIGRYHVDTFCFLFCLLPWRGGQRRSLLVGLWSQSRAATLLTLLARSTRDKRNCSLHLCRSKLPQIRSVWKSFPAYNSVLVMRYRPHPTRCLPLAPKSRGTLPRSQPIMTIHNTSHHTSSHLSQPSSQSLPHRSHLSSHDHHITDLNAHQRKTSAAMPIAYAPIQSKPKSHINKPHITGLCYAFIPKQRCMHAYWFATCHCRSNAGRCQAA